MKKLCAMLSLVVMLTGVSRAEQSAEPVFKSMNNSDCQLTFSGSIGRGRWGLSFPMRSMAVTITYWSCIGSSAIFGLNRLIRNS